MHYYCTPAAASILPTSQVTWPFRASDDVTVRRPAKWVSKRRAVRIMATIWNEQNSTENTKASCKAKRECSPPGCAPRRLLIVVNWSVNWFACVQRRNCTSCRMPPSAECNANPILWIEADKIKITTKIGCHGNVHWRIEKKLKSGVSSTAKILQTL